MIWKTRSSILRRNPKMSKKHKNLNSEPARTAESAICTTQTTNGTNPMRNLGATLTPHKYNATFVRSGALGNKRSALFVVIRDENDHVLCDHLWVRYVRAFDRLSAGDVISFTATPYRYIKGFSSASHATALASDIGLKEITQVRVVGHNPVIEKSVNKYK